MTTTDDSVSAFIVAACVPRDRDHSSGTIEGAEAILAAHPEVRNASIHTAAILGDDALVRQFVALEATNATAKGGRYGWDPLTHLCFSNYLRLDRVRTEGFVRAATALLDAGASANSGFAEPGHQPEPEWEPVLYGACGVAHHPEVTRLLLERGANPNDAEVAYHTPETRDNRAMKLLVETGKLTAESLAIMLIRKHDWHDVQGVKYLLEHGADPNGERKRGWYAMHHALARDNALAMFELLLDHGADPMIVNHGMTAVVRAAHEGRSDVLDLMEQRGIPIVLHGVDALIAACARGDGATVRAIARREPQLVRQLLADGARLLARFTLTENAGGVQQLLDIGVPVTARYGGDGYFGIAKDSTALHVAAWLLRTVMVKLLLERGAQVDVRDGTGRTPLALAVRANVDSYWTERRSPALVEAMLLAGASVRGVPFPSGYDDVDDLLRRHGAAP